MRAPGLIHIQARAFNPSMRTSDVTSVAIKVKQTPAPRLEFDEETNELKLLPWDRDRDGFSVPHLYAPAARCPLPAALRCAGTHNRHTQHKQPRCRVRLSGHMRQSRLTLRQRSCVCHCRRRRRRCRYSYTCHYTLDGSKPSPAGETSRQLTANSPPNLADFLPGKTTAVTVSAMAQSVGMVPSTTVKLAVNFKKKSKQWGSAKFSGGGTDSAQVIQETGSGGGGGGGDYLWLIPAAVSVTKVKKAVEEGEHQDFLVKYTESKSKYIIFVNDQGTLCRYGVAKGTDGQVTFAGRQFQDIAKVVESMKANFFPGTITPELQLGKPAVLQSAASTPTGSGKASTGFEGRSSLLGKPRRQSRRNSRRDSSSSVLLAEARAAMTTQDLFRSIAKDGASTISPDEFQASPLRPPPLPPRCLLKARPVSAAHRSLLLLLEYQENTRCAHAHAPGRAKSSLPLCSSQAALDLDDALAKENGSQATPQGGQSLRDKIDVALIQDMFEASAEMTLLTFLKASTECVPPRRRARHAPCMHM